MLTVIADYAIPALRAMDPESVQCVVTSPPYFSLRDYGIAPVVWDEFVECEHEWESAGAKEGYTGKRKWQHTENGRGEEHAEAYQAVKRANAPDVWNKIEQGQFCRICNAWLGNWGLEPTMQLYLQHTVQVFREVRRVLRKDGTLWLNLGDCYAGGGRGGQSEEKRSKNYQPVYGQSLRGSRNNQEQSREALKSKGGRQSFRRDRVDVGDIQHKATPGLKAKDLMMMPARVAIALCDDGWYLRSDIVWHKPNAMPESCSDRPTRAHEFIFLLTRSSRYYYDHAAIAEPSSPATHARLAQKSLMTQEGGFKQEQYAENFPGKKHRDRKPAEILKAMKRKSNGVTPKSQPTGSGIRANESFHEATSAEVLMMRNKRTVWTVLTAPYSDAHFATFPEALITPCILAGSRAGDTVMDICGGSGTTAAVAIGLGRKCVIIEPKAEYREMIEKRSRVTIGLPLS